jgi:hypothetical protein
MPPLAYGIVLLVPKAIFHPEANCQFHGHRHISGLPLRCEHQSWRMSPSVISDAPCACLLGGTVAFMKPQVKCNEKRTKTPTAFVSHGSMQVVGPNT